MKTIELAFDRLASAALDASEPIACFDAVTLGVFDGLHLGHRHLVHRLVQARRENPVAVITFSAHPAAVLSNNPPARILDAPLRNSIFSSWGVECIVELESCRELFAMPARDFLSAMLCLFEIRLFVAGPDLRFGRHREGDIALLCERLGARVVTVDPLRDGGEIVSSTLVRKALAEGDCRTVRRMLGRPFSCVGSVRSGDGIGRRIGAPTLNLLPIPEALLDGIYVVNTSLGKGVAHVGPRPTLGSDERRFEVHLLDSFDEPEPSDLVEVEFVSRIRDIANFPNLDDLSRAISEDVIVARTILGV